MKSYFNFTIKQYCDLCQQIDDYATADMWKMKFKLYVLLFDDFYNMLKKCLDNKENIDYSYVERLFKEVSENSHIWMEKIQEESRISLKYEYYLKAEAFFGLLETLTEASSFSDLIVEKIKEKYGDEYLIIMQTIDRAMPSKMMNLTNAIKTKKDLNDDIVKIYLLIKEYQDLQYKYTLDSFNDLSSVLEQQYLSQFKNVLAKPTEYWMSKFTIGIRQLLQEKLFNRDLIALEDLAILVRVDYGRELCKLIGGKAFGLACLKEIECKLPVTYVIPVTSRLNNYNLDFLKQDTTYAVRSSATIEDGDYNSFAGIFDTKLNVPFWGINGAVLDVRSSIDSHKVRAYHENMNSDIKMAVIIQEYIEPDYAGVWIGTGSDDGLFEWVENQNGESLVSGHVIPQKEAYDKNNKKFKVKGRYLGDFFCELQHMLNTVSDFEWCILNNEIYMLQFRPVTSIITTENKSINSVEVTENDIIGIPVSPGVATGDVAFIPSLNDVDKWVDGSILITYFTDPEWIPIMKKSSAIVTGFGGFLCHAAIIARELGIPCITGIGQQNIEQIANSSRISINSNNGVIKIID